MTSLVETRAAFNRKRARPEIATHGIEESPSAVVLLRCPADNPRGPGGGAHTGPAHLGVAGRVPGCLPAVVGLLRALRCAFPEPARPVVPDLPSSKNRPRLLSRSSLSRLFPAAALLLCDRVSRTASL